MDNLSGHEHLQPGVNSNSADFVKCICKTGEQAEQCNRNCGHGMEPEPTTVKQDGWISVEESKPPCKECEDYSENVLAVCDGRLMIMAYCYIDSGYDDVSNEDLGGWAWCNCNGDINGDPEFDYEYNVTHWQPLPQPPTKPAGAKPIIEK